VNITTTSGKAPGSISIVDLRERLIDPNLVFVDARTTAAYNGWRLNGEARGGHVPGAVAFPIAWLATVEEAEVQRLLHEKGITHGRTVVVYGDGADDAPALAARLADLGHGDVWVDEAGFSAWAADASLPIERLPNFDKLVHPTWVSRLIAGDSPDTYSGNGFLVYHVNFGVPEEYEEGHLPGALYLDTNRLEDPADWNRRPADELHATLRSLGVAADTTVVLYGRDTIGHANEKWPGRRAGQIAATRAALILAYAGVRDVRVLDGGYDRWVHEGNPVETVSRHPVAVEAFGVEIPQRPGFIVDIGEARSILASDDAALVSVRSWLQLHRPGRPDRRRRLGQLRLGRLSHAALPQCRQHDATLSGDRSQLGGGRNHAGQVGCLLLRHWVAGGRDLVLRLPHGMAADRRVRRRLVRVECRSSESDRGRGSGGRGRRLEDGDLAGVISD
jgi:thiosulfate/3-mercaptopyruvate sulfurtransferase